jgi:hypothetical protein
MFEGVSEIESAHVGTGDEVVSWRQAHSALQGIARRRAALEVDEARWLVVAKRTGVHVGAHHRGRLRITGTAPAHLCFERDDGSRYGEDFFVQAKAALRALGWKATIADAAVDRVGAHVGTGEPLEAVIAAALRECPAFQSQRNANWSHQDVDAGERDEGPERDLRGLRPRLHAGERPHDVDHRQ